MTDEEKINRIIDILDPLCRRRYQEHECFPRGLETYSEIAVNKIQAYREQSARQKAEKIMKLFTDGKTT